MARSHRTNLARGEIREALVRANLVDCIVALPKQLFYNTGIPACLWFLRRGRTNTETLFIDASSMGYMEDRTHRAFANEDVRQNPGLLSQLADFEW